MAGRNIRVTRIAMGQVAAYLVQGERAILVDTGVPGSEGRILSALASQGVDPRQLALILITHAHVDHQGSAAALQAATGAPVAVHRLDAEAVRTGVSAALIPTGFVARLLLPMVRVARTPGVEPTVLVDDALDLQPYGVDGRVIHTPGHTPGSLSVLLANGDAIVGDLVMESVVHRGRPARRPWFATDLKQIGLSVERVISYRPTRILPAHGAAMDPEIVRSALGPKGC